MVKIECENCKKNINNKMGYQIDYGRIECTDYNEAGMPNGMDNPKEIKGDGVFCSLKCIHDWIEKIKKKPRR